jgi:beta-lactamase regulating signal transducer with metallopeptidase domain
MVMSGHFVNSVMESIFSLRDSLLAVSPEFSQTAGVVLLTAIWQGAIVAACLTICFKLTNRISAALRFAVWTAGFLVVVGLPFLPLLSHFGSAPTSQSTLVLAPSVSNIPGPWIQLDIRWSIALTAIWAAASLYRLVHLAAHSVRLRRLWKTATPVSLNADFPASLGQTLQLSGRRRVELCTTTTLDRPSVIGFLAPRILIPEWLFAQLTSTELEQIVLHETEHLRRGDDWTNLLQKLGLIVFPLNPVLLWMERQLCLEREMACDEAVVRLTRAPRAYAACLTSLAERGMHRRSESLSLGAWHRRPELVRRVHSILRRRKALGPLGARSVLTVMACGLIAGTVELSRCPQLIAFTQSPETQTAQSRIMAAQEIPVRMPFRMIDTRFTEPAQNALQATVPARPHAEKVRPLKPSNRGNSPCTSPKGQRAGLNSTAAKLSSRPSPVTLGQTAPRQELLRAEAVSDASMPAQQEQSWIVLTTWEEVDTPRQGALQSDTAINRPSGQGTDKTTEQPASQLKVTQLIFRVVPASTKSHMPTAAPVRGGWLVIQL